MGQKKISGVVDSVKRMGQKKISGAVDSVNHQPIKFPPVRLREISCILKYGTGHKQGAFGGTHEFDF